MTITEKAKELKSLFVYQKDDKKEWYSFNLEAIRSGSEEYQAFSELIRNADVDENTAYEWAATILDDIALQDEEPNEDYISEYADSSTPTYNSDVMDFVRDNPYLVDEALKELGSGVVNDDYGIIRLGQYAYYLAIERFYREIIDILNSLINE